MAQRKELVDGTGIKLYNQAKWSRSTVADGKWLQSDTLDPISANDRILASAIHDVSADLGDMIDYVSATVDANKIELHNEIYVASSYLQDEVNMLEAATDVVDIIGTLPELDTYSERITENDIIKILDTEGTWTDPVTQTEHVFSGDQVYLRYTGETTATPDPTKWTYVGQIKPPNSWKQWSEENDTKVNGANNYYIGSGNSAFGNTVVFGNNNESKSTDKLIKENNTKVYNTQNFIVGNDNSANTTRNAFVFGSKNYSETTQSDLELDSTSQNNDGFTLAFGLENSAIRNYDIAIGREVLASGGENLVVGAPKCYSIDGVTYNTRTVGYKNINFRSDIEGHDNFAIDSVLSGYPLTAHYHKGGPGYNILYHSHINYSGQTPGSFTAMDNNIAIDSEHVNIDIHNGVWPVIGNRFIHARNINFGKDFTGSNDPTITYNNFDNAEQINITGNCSFNNNILLHAKKIDFSGSFFNNRVSDVGNSYDKTTLKTLYAKNNILSHFDTDVLIEAGQSFNDNILTNFGAYGPEINIGAQVIGNNIFKELTFDNTVGSVGYISAYNTPNISNPVTPTIDYNILFNLANLKSSLILTNGAFSKNIMANARGMALAGYTNICNNIINNVTISASADSAKLPNGCNLSQNIILNCTEQGQYYPTNYKVTLENIKHVDGNIIINSKVSAYNNPSDFSTGTTIMGNFILNSNITHEIYNNSDWNDQYIIHNFVFNSLLSGKNERPIPGYSNTFDSNPTQNNVLFNVSALNTYGSFAFGDGYGSDRHRDRLELKNCNSVQVVGQSYADACVQCGIFGTNNFITSAERSFIIGEGNDIIGGPLGSTAPKDNENVVIGINNHLSGNPAANSNGVITRNVLIGKNNAISAVYNANGNPVCDNYLFGFGNAFGIVNDNYNRFSTNAHEFHGNANSAEQVQRNFFIGSYNIASKQVNDSFIFGTRNAIRYNKDNNDTENTTIISNNFIVGAHSLAIAGSNQFNAGLGSITSGYFSMAIGEALIANESQIVLGRFNAEMPGTNGTSASDIDSKSGTLFVIGNGRHKVLDGSDGLANSYKEENIERSNAMLVSANGAVSSKYVLASDGFSGVNISGSTKTASIDSLIGSNNTIMGSLYEYSNPDPTVRTISTLGIYQQYNHRKSYQIVCTAEDTTTASYGYLMSTTEENLTDTITASALHFAESAASGIIEYRSVSRQSQGNFTLTSGLYVKKDTTQGREIIFGYYDSSNNAHDVAELIPDNHVQDQYLTTDAQNKVVWSNKPDVLNGIAVKLVATSGDATEQNVLYIVTGA